MHDEIIPPNGGIFQVFHMAVRPEVIGRVVVLRHSNSFTAKGIRLCAKIGITVKYRTVIAIPMSIAGFGKEGELGCAPG